ncbi:MAG: NYN domain-containing protein [Candidatus Parcubacteria bacterium]|nr:NYN domain-containing protein [Candidatus Parcubacteria bacterium]
MKSQKHPDQRVVILIDAQNLYYSAKHLYRSKVNFEEVLKLAIADRLLIRAFAYVVQTKTGEEKPFFEALTGLGIETRIKPLQEYYGGQKKADWDVGIVVDAIRASATADVIILVSGDGDFIPLVEYLKNQGKRVEIIAFGRSTSSKIKEATDEFIDLESDTKKYLLKKS